MDNIDNTSHRDGIVVIAVTIELVVVTIAVPLRVYTRKVTVKKLGLDDWATVVSLILTIACGIAIILNIKNGLGYHIWTLEGNTIKEYMKAFYVSVIFYHTALLTVKVSILLQYYRIFPLENIRKACPILLAIIICWGISQVFIVIFNCRPISGFWDKTIESTCVPFSPQWYINAGGNIIPAFAIFFLPLPVIGRLHLPPLEKFLVVGIFALGLFTCAISIVRIQFLVLKEDFSYVNVAPAIWSVGEFACGLTCACLPTHRPLLSKYVPNILPRKWSEINHNLAQIQPSQSASGKSTVI